MSNNNVNTLCRIDQAIRGLNDDGTDDSYVPAQSANGALERIEKSIKELDIKGINSGLPKVTNADNGKVLQVKNGKWGKGDIDTPVELITGDIDYNNNVTLSHSGQEIFAMMSDGKLPIIFLEHDSLYGKTYEVYNYTAWYIDSNQEKIFEFTRIRRYEGRTVFWTVPINTVSASNVFKAKSESISNGPTRTVLFESPDGGGVWMDSPTKHFELNDDIDNYDEIEIVCLTTEGDNNYYYAGTQKYTVTDLLEPRKDTLNMGMPFRVSAVRTTGLDTSSLSVVLIPQGTSDTIAKRSIVCLSAIGGNNWGVAIHRVIGVKY